MNSLNKMESFFKMSAQMEVIDHYLLQFAQTSISLQQQLEMQQKRLIDMDKKLSEQSNLMVEEFNRIDKGLNDLNQKISDKNKILEKIEAQIDFSNGVWTDPDTGLMWSRISIGQKWVRGKGKCKGYASEMTFVEAEQTCQDLWLAGFHDWRLPTIEELQTLQIDEDSGFKHQEYVLCKPTEYDWGKYWSKSRYEEDDSILFINFNEGKRYRSVEDTYTCYVRAVRLV